MKYLFLLFFFILKVSYAIDLKNQFKCVHDNKNFRCVKYIKNHDGDTITFHIPNVHPIIGKKIKVRLSNVDTAEIDAKNPCEKNKALEAKNKVEALLKAAKRIDLENVKRGRYFRIVADVKIDDRSLAEELIKSNLAYYYKGKKKQKINWCKKNIINFSKKPPL